MNRKTLIIIFVAIILFGVGAYFYFSKKAPAPATTPTATFPGGSGSFTGTSAGGGVPSTDTSIFVPGSSATLPRLYELHKVPVAGVGFIEEGKAPNNKISARYIERGLGHIYETPFATLVESRIVNETRSRIMEALWGNGGKSVVVRSIDDQSGGSVIKSSILNLGGVTTSFARGTSTLPVSDFTKTEEVPLPDYIPFVATVEDGADKLFYMENGVGASVGSLTTFKKANTSTVFTSAFTEWLPQFPNQNLVTLTTKPSALVPGHFFFVEPKTRSVTKILGGLNGLTTLTSHNGKLVLFAETKASIPELSIYDVSKNTTLPLFLQTLPEKCVWGFKNPTIAYCAVPQALPSAIYPDQWYQGVVSFSDALWEIDTTTGRTQKIMTPANFGAPVLDMINLSLSSDDTHLLFMNKVSGTPWMYRIVEPTVATPPPVSISTKTVTQPLATTTTPDMKKVK